MLPGWEMKGLQEINHAPKTPRNLWPYFAFPTAIRQLSKSCVHQWATEQEIQRRGEMKPRRSSRLHPFSGRRNCDPERKVTFPSLIPACFGKLFCSCQIKQMGEILLEVEERILQKPDPGSDFGRKECTKTTYPLPNKRGSVIPEKKMFPLTILHTKVQMEKRCYDLNRKAIHLWAVGDQVI